MKTKRSSYADVSGANFDNSDSTYKAKPRINNNNDDLNNSKIK